MLDNDDNSSGLSNSTEQLILKAAEKEFMTKGFAAARTTAIAREAGVTHAMFHYYFRTKDKLFKRILEEKMSLVAGALLKPLEDLTLPIDDVIRNIVTGHLDFLAANPNLARFLFVEINTDEEHAAEHYLLIKGFGAQVMHRFQDKLNYAAAHGQCRKIDARMLMLDIASLNIFPFLAEPPIKVLFGNSAGDFAAFIERRKAENIDTILRKIR